MNLNSFKDYLKDGKINFSPMPFETFLRILYQFQIIIPIGDEDTLVPSQLYNHPFPMPKQLEFEDMVIRRHVFSPAIPHGFMERLISRLFFFMKEMIGQQNLLGDPTFAGETIRSKIFQATIVQSLHHLLRWFHQRM